MNLEGSYIAKQSKFALALKNIDARLGALRDIANYIGTHGGDAERAADTEITSPQTARNLLTSAVDGPTNGSAKPKRTRKAKAAKEPEAKA